MKLQHFLEILGHGKSTLINALFEEDKTLVGSLSKKLQRGKNTTTSITLYKIKDGYISTDEVINYIICKIMLLR